MKRLGFEIGYLARAEAARYLARGLLHTAHVLRTLRAFEWGAWCAIRAGNLALYALDQLDRLEGLA